MGAATAALRARGQDLHKEKAELAKQYFDMGVALYKNGDHGAALENFVKSYELRPHDKLRYNMGICLYLLGEYARAGNEFVRFMMKEAGDAEPKMIKEALKLLDDIKKKCGVLKIKAEDEGIRIRIDGREHGKTPLPTVTYVHPGTHDVQALVDDDVAWSGRVNVGAGESKVINLPSWIKPEKEKAEEEKASKEPEKQDGQKSHAGKNRVQRSLFYLSLALGLAAAAGGAASGGIAVKKANDLDDLDRGCEKGHGCGTAEQFNDYLDTRNDVYAEAEVAGKTSTGLFIVSGAFALSSLIILLVTKPFKKESPEGISSPGLPPLVFPGEHGPVLTVNF